MIIANFYANPIQLFGLTGIAVNFCLLIFLCLRSVSFVGPDFTKLLTFDGNEITKSADNLAKMKNLSYYLEQTESDLANFFILSDDWLLMVKEGGHIIKTNPTGMRVLGWSKEELLDMTVDQLLHPDDVAGTRDYRAKMYLQETTKFVNRWRCKDGSYKTFSWSATRYNTEGVTYAVGRELTNTPNVNCTK